MRYNKYNLRINEILVSVGDIKHYRYTQLNYDDERNI